MSTTGTVAIQAEDGSIRSIYVHWDNYLTGTGDILLRHYTQTEKIMELIGLGDLSSVGPEIGTKHEFENPYNYGSREYVQWEELYDNMCVAYARDRDEELQPARTFANAVEWLKEFGEEYNYLWTGDCWLVNMGSNGFVKLTQELIDQEG